MSAPGHASQSRVEKRTECSHTKPATMPEAESSFPQEFQRFGFRVLPPGRAVQLPHSTLCRLGELLHDEGFHMDDGYVIAIHPEKDWMSLINRIPRGRADKVCDFLATKNIDNIDPSATIVTEDNSTQSYYNWGGNERPTRATAMTWGEVPPEEGPSNLQDGGRPRHVVNSIKTDVTTGSSQCMELLIDFVENAEEHYAKQRPIPACTPTTLISSHNTADLGSSSDRASDFPKPLEGVKPLETGQSQYSQQPWSWALLLTRMIYCGMTARPLTTERWMNFFLTVRGKKRHP